MQDKQFLSESTIRTYRDSFSHGQSGNKNSRLVVHHDVRQVLRLDTPLAVQLTEGDTLPSVESCGHYVLEIQKRICHYQQISRHGINGCVTLSICIGDDDDTE